MQVKWNRPVQLTGLFLLIGLFLYAGSHRIGIDPFDESVYLFTGEFVTPATFITNQSWGPLYDLWYHLLGYVCPNPISRYFLSWELLAGLCALIPALFNIRYAWLYACLLIASPLLLGGPYVSLLAAVLLLCGTCVLLRWGRTWRLSSACVLACGLCFLTAFVRPEYGYGVILSAGATLVAQWVEFRHGLRARAAGWKAAGALSLAGVMLLFQRHAAATNRSGMAFVQHFYMRAALSGLIKPGEGIDSDYTQRMFGLDQGRNYNHLTHTLGDYFHANPRLFLHHVLANVTDRRTLILLLFLLVVGVGLWFLRGGELRPVSVYLGCICVPPLVAISLFYPRNHYAMILVPTVALLIVQLLPAGGVLWLRSPRGRIVATMAVVLFFAFLVRVTQLELRYYPFDFQRRNLARAQCAQDVDRAVSNPSPMVFDGEQNLSIYALHYRNPVQPFELANFAGFKAWVAAKRPVWIAVDPEVEREYAVQRQTMDDFLQRESHYTPHACPVAAEVTIYTQNDR